jgi:hypothetical protein
MARSVEIGSTPESIDASTLPLARSSPYHMRQRAYAFERSNLLTNAAAGSLF